MRYRQAPTAALCIRRLSTVRMAQDAADLTEAGGSGSRCKMDPWKTIGVGMMRANCRRLRRRVLPSASRLRHPMSSLSWHGASGQPCNGRRVMPSPMLPA